MTKQQNELVETLLKDMLLKFREDFLKKELEIIDAKVSQKDGNVTLNLLFSFAVSAFLNTVMPVLRSAQDKDKAIQDGEKLLHDMHVAMMQGLKGHTPVGRIIT